MNLLQAENVSLRLNGTAILSTVDFSLKSGEMLGLIGPNGAGKTTLLRLLAGLYKPTMGSVQLEGAALASFRPQQRARLIAYLAQNGTAHWPMSVERIVELGRLPHLESWREPAQSDAKIVDSILAQTELLDLRERAFDTLSGGEKSRVLLARALAAEPRILLADEPVASLDPAHQLAVLELLANHCREGGAVVVILHDLRLASHFCGRLQLLHQGKTLALGRPSEVLTERNLATAFQVELHDKCVQRPNPFELTWKRKDPSL